MGNPIPVQILDPCNDLLEVGAGLVFAESA